MLSSTLLGNGRLPKDAKNIPFIQQGMSCAWADLWEGRGNLVAFFFIVLDSPLAKAGSLHPRKLVVRLSQQCVTLLGSDKKRRDEKHWIPHVWPTCKIVLPSWAFCSRGVLFLHIQSWGPGYLTVLLPPSRAASGTYQRLPFVRKCRVWSSQERRMGRGWEVGRRQYVNSPTNWAVALTITNFKIDLINFNSEENPMLVKEQVKRGLKRLCKNMVIMGGGYG